MCGWIYAMMPTNTRLKFGLVLVCIVAVVPIYFTLVYLHRQRPHIRLSDLHSGNLSSLVSAFSTTPTGRQRPGVPDVPILLWWDSVYDKVDEVKTCGQRACRISNNRSLRSHPDTKGFIFYGSHFQPYNLPLPRQPHHTWALIHEESPRNAFILSHGNSLNIFNFTSTYNRKSDYPITTQWLKCADWIQDTKYVLPLVDKNRLRRSGLAPILYIHSDCGVPSDRDKYVELLQQYIDVDSYGACKNNRELPKRLRFRDDMSPLQDDEFYQFVARYKFSLAFENYVCEDYITEKFWRPIRTGSVPIVFGAPNIRDYLPANKSAIILDEFEDVEDLANYLHLLDTNDRLYLEYLDYKEEPIRNNRLRHQLNQRDWEPNFCSNQRRNSKTEHYTGNFIHTSTQLKRTNLEPKYNSIFYGFECFLCNAITNILTKESMRGDNNGKVTPSDQYRCPSPRRFDDNGHYSIHDKHWSAEWLYGKYEASVMETLYTRNKICSKKDFNRMVRMEYNQDQ